MLNTSLILVRPQMGENIGAAARAMANFGLRELRLVAPRDGWPSESAQAMSSGAFAHMDDVQVYASLAEALHDIHYAYATTARPRDMIKPVVTPREAAQQSYARDAAAKTAFVFGAERAGLDNDDVSRCHAIVTAPTSPDFSSLNLGQGVLMVAYELFCAQHEATPPAAVETALPAAQENFDNLFSRLEAALASGGFFRDEGLRPKVTRNLRNTLMRAQMSDNEINTFHGVIRALTGARNSH
jgi:tRNA/rRNA methyltransferase